jgi:predicted enzyme related to lactoylglutathione lyase
MSAFSKRLGVLFLASLVLLVAVGGVQATGARGQTDIEDTRADENAMRVQYLEIVTPLVDETCDALAKTHSVVFGDPVAELGNARTADLKDGGRIGVRAPMRSSEEPVVRPYILVEDIEDAIQAAEAAGAQIALPAMKIPGQGTISIYILGGIEHGLWEL